MRISLALALSAIGLAAGTAVAADGTAQRLLQMSSAMFGIVEPTPPADLTTPAAELGRALFWDARLSLDGQTSCASCHTAKDWSSDNRQFSLDARGNLTSRHSQPVFMSMDQVALRWNGDRRDGAHQAERSIVGSMGMPSMEAMVPLLMEHGYEPLFKAAFPGDANPVSPTNYGRAMEVYQRTLNTPAPFDDFLAGDIGALTTDQLRGLEKFVNNGCAACHNGKLLGGNSIQRFGLVKEYWLATGSENVDKGRYLSTGKEEDQYLFRTPMLRNITKTAPYFHDGTVETLEEAVRIMAEVQFGREVPAADIQDIVTFLEALTGDIPENYAPPKRFPGTKPQPMAAR